MHTFTIKTASDLKYHVEQTGSHFFERSSMKFFGDTMKNYGVRKTTVETHILGQVEVYELYRRKPVKHGNQSSAYFNAFTFERVFPKSK